MYDDEYEDDFLEEKDPMDIEIVNASVADTMKAMSEPVKLKFISSISLYIKTFLKKSKAQKEVDLFDTRNQEGDTESKI